MSAMQNTFTCLLLFALLPFNALFSQKNSDEKAIKAVINRFFEGMERHDTILLKSACTETPMLQTFMADKEGKWRVFTEDFGELVAFVGSPAQDKFQERIEFGNIEAEQSLASVWAPYKFYLNGKLSHCGTDSFQLIKTADGWKIQYIIDTRRKSCGK